MRPKKSTSILILLSLTTSIFGANLPKQDIEAITTDVELFVQQFNNKNHAHFVEKMPSRIFSVLGVDRKTMLELTNKSMKEIYDKGGEITGYNYTLLNKLYECENISIVFVKLLATIEMKDLVIDSDGFIIASKDSTNESWHYIDGTFLRENRPMFDQIYGCKGVDISFPEVKNDIRRK